jgi:hypothetical protein
MRRVLNIAEVRRLPSSLAALVVFGASRASPVFFRCSSLLQKPSVANAIASILGGNPRKRAGKSKYNPVFEFSFNWRGGPGRNFVVTSVTGHLMEVDFPPQYRSWSARDPIALFTAPIVRGVKVGRGRTGRGTLCADALHRRRWPTLRRS